jgi:hypothetical protein
LEQLCSFDAFRHKSFYQQQEQLMEVIEATVKFPPGRAFESQFGPRVNALLSLLDGTDIKVWGNPNDVALSALKRGQAVKVLVDHRGKYKLLETSQEPLKQPTALKTGHIMTDDDKRAIAERIQQEAALLRYCLTVSKEKFADLITGEESFRALATTLFLRVTR